MQGVYCITQLTGRGVRGSKTSQRENRPGRMCSVIELEMQAFPPAEVQILKTAARRFAFGFPNALSGHYPHARAVLAHLNPGPGGPEGIGYHLFRETAAS